MPYKHKETGKYYDISSYSEYDGKITQKFRSWDNKDDIITISVNKIIDTDNMNYFDNPEKFKEANSANNLAFKKEVDKVFELVSLKPNITVTEKHKYIPVIVNMTCPLCGSPLITDGKTYLTDPLQYEHECSNPDCNYHICLSRWYVGQELWVTSVEDVNRIITNGTNEEQEELEKITRENKRRK